MEIEFDPKKAVLNIKKHGVSFDEARTSLLDSNALVQEETNSTEESRWVLIGLSHKIRLLTVVYTLRDKEQRIRIISARKATKKETNCYA